MDNITIVAAVVEDKGRYLCMQRCRSHESHNSERWEFPGGKVEEGETEHETLLREIKEEMDWDVYVGQKLCTIEHSYPHFNVVLKAYLCKPGDGPFTLLEHLDARWLTREELPQLRWTDADRKVVEVLLNRKDGKKDGSADAAL